MSSEARAPARSYLFAPGSSEKLLERVFEAGSDAVVLDLEDAVPEGEKDLARRLVAERVAGRVGLRGPEVHVRVNAPDSPRAREDIAAAVQPGLDAVRLPKAEEPASVQAVSRWIAQAEERQGLAAGSVRLDLTIETARGIARARELAACDPRVGRLVFGQADFLADVGAEAGPEGLETLYARSEVVIAARTAGLLAPLEGAYARLRDQEGLRRAAQAARRLGFGGMSAIHPEQIPVIHEVFTPTAAEAERAQELLRAYEEAIAAGSGAARLQDGRFVDRPIAERARRTVLLFAREKGERA